MYNYTYIMYTYIYLLEELRAGYGATIYRLKYLGISRQ